MNVTVLIPAYQPSIELPQLVNELKRIAPGLSILIVDDGSGNNYKSIFEQAKNLGATVLKHPQNQGKGAALKTGFLHYLTYHHEQHCGIVTADADGQHTATDILMIVKKISNTPDHLHLGARNFDGKVPLRSLFGNRLTAKVLKLFNHTTIKDTQTGLRGIPNSLVKTMLDSHANRYEFELEMLLNAEKLNIPIEQHTIATVYLNDNEGSHFNPILDSLKIYWVFIRFAASALISFIVDFTLFVILHRLLGKVFLSLLLARTCSCLVNFAFNHNLVFKNQLHWLRAFFRYFCAVFANLLISYAVINLLTHLHLHIYISKIISDFFVFLINFYLQKRIVFAHKHEQKEA